MANKLLFRGQHISAIAAISFGSGLLDCYTVIGSVTGNEFLTFIRNSLVPSITPFNGHSPRSTLINYTVILLSVVYLFTLWVIMLCISSCYSC